MPAHTRRAAAGLPKPHILIRRFAPPLLLGLLTSLLIAWAIALPIAPFSNAEQADILTAPSRGGVAASAIRTRTLGRDTIRTWNGLFSNVAPRAAGPRALAIPPWWLRFRDPVSGVIASGDLGVAAGWPARCMSAWLRYDHPAGKWSVRHGVASGALNATPSADQRVVPLRPIWAGLALNTAFFGAVWVVIIASARAWQRAGAPLASPIVIAAALGFGTTIAIAFTGALRNDTPSLGRTATLLFERSGRARFAGFNPTLRPPPGVAAAGTWFDSSGWPARALACAWMEERRAWLYAGNSAAPTPPPPARSPIAFGILLDSGAGGPPVRALPLHPVWSGLAVNTAFYGAAWFMILGAGALAKSHRRRKRGLCPHCAYALGAQSGDGCPECGWNRPPGPQQPTSARRASPPARRRFRVDTPAAALRLTGAFLALGLLISLVVAWSAAYRQPAPSQIQIFVDSAGRSLLFGQPPRRIVRGRAAALDQYWLIVGFGSDTAGASSTPPRWLVDAAESDSLRHAGFIDGAAAGWPLRCVRTVRAELGSTRIVHGGIRIPPARGPAFIRTDREILVPARPIVLGLALNTMFYGAGAAALLALVTILPSTLLHHTRDARRRRKGHCPRCAYDLQRDFKAGCPECGWNRAPARPAIRGDENCG